MENHAEIPGFYWDPDKNRYFRIHNTGELHESGYSKSAVAERNRSATRKLTSERARLVQGSAPTFLRQNEYAFKQLKKRAVNAYMGSPTEIISGLFMLSNGQLVTGSRNGTFSVGQQRSSCARSIVAVNEWGSSRPVLAAVSDEGSIAAWSRGCVTLPGRYINSLCSVDDSLLMATDRGLVSVGADGTVGEEQVGRITTVARAEEFTNTLLGGPAGQIWRLDRRSQRRGLLARMPERAAVTHIGTLRDPRQVVACGLKDEMYVFDTRGSTEPLLRFPHYHNWSSLTHGFAVNKEGTACAVAMDNHDVAVLDAATGKKVGLFEYRRSRVAQAIVPPSVLWAGSGVYIASMNSVRLHLRRGAPDPALSPTPGASDECLSMQALAEQLSAKIKGTSPALLA